MAGPMFPKLTDQGNKTASVCSCDTTWAWTRSELDGVGRSHWGVTGQDFSKRSELQWARHGRRGGAADTGHWVPRKGTCTVAGTCVRDPALSDLAISPSCTRTLVFVSLTVPLTQGPFFFCTLPRMSLCTTRLLLLYTSFIVCQL